MITKSEIDQINRILSFAFSCKMSENPLAYDPSSRIQRANTLTLYPNHKQVTSVWMDIDHLNEVKLKRLFSRHKEINLPFFVNYLDGFYRVGWKVKKQG